MLIAQGLKFIAVGIATTAANFLAIVFCVEVLGMDPVIATFPAFLAAFIVSYRYNYRWTFRSTAAHAQSVGRYLALALFGIATKAAIMYICVDVLAWSYLIGFAVGVLVVPPITFFGSRHLVFHRRAG